MNAEPDGFVCPNGHDLGRWQLKNGCRICRAEAALAETAELLAQAVPALGRDARAVVEDVTSSARRATSCGPGWPATPEGCGRATPTARWQQPG